MDFTPTFLILINKERIKELETNPTRIRKQKTTNNNAHLAKELFRMSQKKRIIELGKQYGETLDCKAMKNIAREVGTTAPKVMRILQDENIYKLIPNN